MATWAWNTNDEVDAEVKRALLNYRPIFARYCKDIDRPARQVATVQYV